MNPPSPTCATDFIWWAFLGLVSILGYLLSLFLKRGVIDRLDGLNSRIEGFAENCRVCQADTAKNYVPRSEYDHLQTVRTEVHRVINGRLDSLDVSQRDISNKLTTYHEDLVLKITRLSKTFVFRDAVISMRLDNLSDRVGLEKWTKDKEEAMAQEFKDKLELVNE